MYLSLVVRCLKIPYEIGSSTTFYLQEILKATTQDAGVTDEQKALAQELRSIENGPIFELEKAIAARKKLGAKAKETLERLMSDLDVAKIDLKGREATVKSSREDVEEVRRKVAKVRYFHRSQ